MTYKYSDCSALTSVYITNLESWCSIQFSDSWSNPILYSKRLYLNGEEVVNLLITNTVTSIGDYAFYGCSSFTSVTIPESVTSIGDYAFRNCNSLTSITIPESVTSIGDYAFGNCNSLTSFLIPNSVTNISEGLFYDCDRLTSITIPNSVTRIGKSAFRDCSGLTSVYITDLETWCRIAFINFASNPLNCGANLYLNKKEVKNLVIPNSVTSIKDYAFYGCSSFTSVTIPDSVTSFGKSTFEDCSSLTNITIGNSVKSIGNYAFSNCPLTNITIPNSVTSIGESTFEKCSSLTDITIGNSVTSIGKRSFYGCSSLTNITIPNSVTSIGSSAFGRCNKLTEFICNATTPPICGAKALDDINKETCTLKVLKGCAEAYQAADQWKDFLSVEEYVTKFLLTWKIDDEVLKADSITYGETVDIMEVPTKEGYTFSGWSEVPATMPSGDFTISGTFIPNTYTLTYKVDGEEYAKEEVTFGTTITQKEAPTKEGHTFSGWNEVPETMPAGDVTVEGTFTINNYAIKYIVDGVEYATDNIPYNSDIVLREEPVREGYTFSGWSEVPETMPAEEVKVVGSFTLNSYSLTYVLDGKVYKKETLFYGAQVNAVENPEKEGHTFSGWSEMPATMPAQDVTVEGTFTVNTYKLTYMVDGEVYATMQIQYGSPLYLIAEPTKEGFIFSGWSEIPETMPAYDVEVTGEFASGISTITVENDFPIYNLQGIEMKDKENLPAGIYIQGGKKIVVK